MIFFLKNIFFTCGVSSFFTGDCTCRMMYSPYMNTREFKPWAGEDCSYIHPYAAAARRFDLNFIWGIVLIVSTIFFVFQRQIECDNKEEIEAEFWASWGRDPQPSAATCCICQWRAVVIDESLFQKFVSSRLIWAWSKSYCNIQQLLTYYWRQWSVCPYDFDQDETVS